MRRLTFSVPQEYNGCRLKGFLRSYCGVSARLLVRLKRQEDGLTVNGEPATAITILHTFDVVCLCLPPDQNQPVPCEVPLSVLYEDEDLLVADKPAGMAMYPVPGSDTGTLANAAAFYWQAQGHDYQFRPVYRLDKNTSGVVILAKNAYVAAALSHNIQKEYTAVCEGLLTGEGTIDTPISLEEGSKIKRTVSPNGITAITHWKSIQCLHTHTLLNIQLETGRTHQIRVHMSSISHPLAGDDLYGGRLNHITRQALHCRVARLIHPITKKTLLLTAPLPADFVLLLEHENV